MSISRGQNTLAFRGSKPPVILEAAVTPATPPKPDDGSKQLKKAFDLFGPPPASEE